MNMRAIRYLELYTVIYLISLIWIGKSYPILGCNILSGSWGAFDLFYQK